MVIYCTHFLVLVCHGIACVCQSPVPGREPARQSQVRSSCGSNVRRYEGTWLFKVVDLCRTLSTSLTERQGFPMLCAHMHTERDTCGVNFHHPRQNKLQNRNTAVHKGVLSQGGWTEQFSVFPSTIASQVMINDTRKRNVEFSHLVTQIINSRIQSLVWVTTCKALLSYNSIGFFFLFECHCKKWIAFCGNVRHHLQ